MAGHGKSQGGRRPKRHVEEEHENHERWLVTYADMITLLMVLFIVLFAMSQVDQKKFNALKSGLAAGFGQSTSILDGSESILSESGVSEVKPIAPPKYADVLPEIDQVRVNEAVQKQLQQQNERRYADAQAEANRLVDIEKRLISALAKRGLQDDVRTVIDGRGLTVSLVSHHVVFEPNLADLSARGKYVLNVLGPVLGELTDSLSIEGHTNQVPVKPKYFATDWDLAAARGITVLRYLNEQLGIPQQRLSAASWGHTKPLIDPSRPGSQQLNKRVDIIVRSGLDEESSQLLSLAAADIREENS
jgi:chemotaxis protein MotB